MLVINQIIQTQMNLKKTLFILFLLVQVSSYAQNTSIETDDDRFFREGLELFDKAQFSAARTAFEEYINRDPNSLKAIDAEYYIAYSALVLFHNDGDYLLEKFVKDYPGHQKAVYAYYELGNFYFSQKDYQAVIVYLERTDVSQLTETERLETRFKLGYSHFTKKSFDQAQGYFNIVKKTKNQYTAAASYYAGFIAYRNGNYDEALADLLRAEEDPAYASIVPYMIMNVYFKQEKYDALLAYGEKVIESGRKIKNKADFNLLIGDAYFRKGEFDKAAEYFRAYVDNNRTKPKDDVKYRLGYALYVIGDYDNAAAYLKKLASNRNELGQFSAYYLGNIYLKQGNENFALTAFNNARRMDFDMGIQEESIYNYAKLSYSAGNYDEAIDALNELTEKYPASKKLDEANDLISEAYLNTSDYGMAMEHLESIQDKSPQAKKTYQKVTYFRGTEQFNAGKYAVAVDMFKKSLQYPENSDLVVKANYWTGEAYSIGKKWEPAISSYSAVFQADKIGRGSEYWKSRYGIGYAFYNTKQYNKALGHFKDFSDNGNRTIDHQFFNDALIRLADCYYVTKDYNNALMKYDQAINKNSPDRAYAYYQKGVIYGIKNNTSEAKKNFEIVINRFSEDRYYDKAVYQKAELDFQKGDYVAAAKGFTYLIDNKANSSMTPYALLKRGFSYYNLKKYSKSINDYKKIIDNYTTTSAAESAITSLQEVLGLENRSGEFDIYLARFKSGNPDNKSIDNIEYETAKSLYNNQKYEKAIASFRKYIRSNGNSVNAYEAKYFIAESYYRLKDYKGALDYYYEVESDNKTGRGKKAVQRIAEIEFNQGNYNKAVAYYKKSAANASSKKQSYNAWSGLMESYLHLRQYDEVTRYANLILEKGNVSADASNKATLYKGKAAYAQKDYDTAIDEFITTSNAAKDEYGAEAQYLMGDIFYRQAAYNRSIETLIDLSSNYGSYEKWLGKAFLLISDNYVALKEYFQAEGTLNSIIENSPDQEIVNKAKAKLIKLKALQEGAKNRGVQIESDTTFQEFN